LSRKISTIGIVSPADWLDPQILQQGAEDLRTRGFAVKIHPACHQQKGRFAGDDKSRANALMEFYADSEIDLLLAAKGGYGSMRLLDLLDYEIIKANPKPLCGSSDNTAIINGIFAKTGNRGFVSPMVLDFAAGKSVDGLAEFLSAVEAPAPKELSIGGNMAVFMALFGTEFLPAPEGKVLVLEEIAEPIYKIDRFFRQLWLSGYLQKLAGLKIGWFKNISDSPVRPSGFSLDDILDEFDEKLPYKITRNFAFGHGMNSHTLPIG
jgi:muramoyltetrapeptide carboxypeptidase